MDVADGSALLQVENSKNRKSEAVLEVKVALKTYGRQKILNFHASVCPLCVIVAGLLNI